MGLRRSGYEELITCPSYKGSISTSREVPKGKTRLGKTNTILTWKRPDEQKNARTTRRAAVVCAVRSVKWKKKGKNGSSFQRGEGSPETRIKVAEASLIDGERQS